jgi:hypothetical protein
MPKHAPRSYDEIVRATVLDPDSSWRPTPEQEKRAYEGFRAMDPEEQQLCADIHDALLAAGMDTTKIQIEVDRDRVILRGQVYNARQLAEIPEIVRGVEGVGSVVDKLVIAP